MTKYDVTWSGLDSGGREGTWKPSQWLGVLEILSRYDGHSYTDLNSPMYDELEQRFPSDTWRSGGHSMFRDYRYAWARTDLIKFEDNTLRITDLGRKLLEGSIDPSEVLKRSLVQHREGDDYPFRVLASAFLQTPRPLSLSEIYHGVMRNYRPGLDNLGQAVSQVSDDVRNPRRMRHMIGLLEKVNAVASTDKSNEWMPWDRDVLRQIAGEESLAYLGYHTPSLDGLIEALNSDLAVAGLMYDSELISRFTSALITKPFIILTGLAGSGKTKLALSFAQWLTWPTSQQQDVFAPGTEIISDRISYYVADSDLLSVEFLNSEDGDAIRATLPRALIQEWVNVIKANDFTRDTPLQTIRDAVVENTTFSPQLSSFKTHLKAAAFAIIESEDQVEYLDSYEVIAVGADWTSNEQVLGYPDALDKGRYIRTRALNLILRAIENPSLPFFLILDEMNLSHVERYFADILSAIESREPIFLHGNDSNRTSVPPLIHLPPNLFIIGTVNVDETTYMFSPKVLDRANTIEFRVAKDQIAQFINHTQTLDPSAIAGKGNKFGRAFVSAATGNLELDGNIKQQLRAEMLLFFEVLRHYGIEFGFRTAAEISRFVAHYMHLHPNNTDDALIKAIDAQVLQKILPRLNGSRTRLEPVLWAMAFLCHEKRVWDDIQDVEKTLVDRAVEASMRNDEEFRPDSSKIGDAYLRQSYEKIVRMYRLLDQNGFASFAEA